MNTIASGMVLFAVLSVPAPFACSDPPAGAPAHGWRTRHDPFYVGYGGKKWERDYGVLDGRCNREAVGAVLGGMAGAAIGSRLGKGEGRPVATVLGAIVGVTAGARLGRDMDEKDRACVGHALELAGAERDVTWTNNGRAVTYRVIPLGGYSDNGRPCREFVTLVSAHGRDDTIRHKACSAGDGVWRIVG